MNGQQQAETGKQNIKKPGYKFLIGFVGGLSAACFPRLMASLTLSDSSDVVLLSVGYLSLAFLFATLIGAVVMIMEWGVPKEPSATFMTAIGIPALLAGAMNTSNGAYELDVISKENMKLTEAIESLSPIPEEEESYYGITPLSDVGVEIKPKSTNAITLNIISTAHADNRVTKQRAFNLNPGMQIQQQQYYIILDKASSEAEAKKKAAKIKLSVPNAQAVKAGNKYLVIDLEAKTKSAAVLESIQLKKKGFRPVLLKQK